MISKIHSSAQNAVRLGQVRHNCRKIAQNRCDHSVTAQSRCVARHEMGSEHVAFCLLEAISPRSRQQHRDCKAAGVISDDCKFAKLPVTGDDAAQIGERRCSTGCPPQPKFVGWWPLTLTADRDEPRGLLSERVKPSPVSSSEAVLWGDSFSANAGARTFPGTTPIPRVNLARNARGGLSLESGRGRGAASCLPHRSI